MRIQKTCITCRFCDQSRMASMLPPRCDRWGEDRTIEDPVYGDHTHRARETCAQERSADGRCGPEGKSWELKPPPKEPSPKTISDKWCS